MPKCGWQLGLGPLVSRNQEGQHREVRCRVHRGGPTLAKLIVPPFQACDFQASAFPGLRLFRPTPSQACEFLASVFPDLRLFRPLSFQASSGLRFFKSPPFHASAFSGPRLFRPSPFQAFVFLALPQYRRYRHIIFYINISIIAEDYISNKSNY